MTEDLREGPQVVMIEIPGDQVRYGQDRVANGIIATDDPQEVAEGTRGVSRDST